MCIKTALSVCVCVKTDSFSKNMSLRGITFENPPFGLTFLPFEISAPHRSSLLLALFKDGVLWVAEKVSLNPAMWCLLQLFFELEIDSHL